MCVCLDKSMDRADVINAVHSHLCDIGESQTLERLQELEDWTCQTVSSSWY
uniref:Uncharacterized protein n=1 Tax=Arion vulgaris TaxID=1028688 RepID=A0A0B7AHS9_9EUPU